MSKETAKARSVRMAKLYLLETIRWSGRLGGPKVLTEEEINYVSNIYRRLYSVEMGKPKKGRKV